MTISHAAGPAFADSSYPPIAEHGLIGDMHTAALIASEGTIDWYCVPRFDSPSVFAAILDRSRGGHFSLRSQSWARTTQFYFPDTNVLITRFFSSDGVGEIQDFMPIASDPRNTERHRLIRHVRCVRGRMHFEATIAPRFDYARAEHSLHFDPRLSVFESGLHSLGLSSTVELERSGEDVSAAFVLGAGESATFALDHRSPTGVAGSRNRATAVAGAR